jgi:hypothetical protein
MENQALNMGRASLARRLAVRWTAVGAMVLLAGLTACRKEEQGRELHMEKGTYQGQADTAIGEQTADELRQRTMRQRAW